jgi:hypothetical protein
MNMEKFPLKAWGKLSRDQHVRSGPDQRGDPHPPTSNKVRDPAHELHLLLVTMKKDRETIE